MDITAKQFLSAIVVCSAAIALADEVKKDDANVEQKNVLTNKELLFKHRVQPRQLTQEEIAIGAELRNKQAVVESSRKALFDQDVLIENRKKEIVQKDEEAKQLSAEIESLEKSLNEKKAKLEVIFKTDAEMVKLQAKKEELKDEHAKARAIAVRGVRESMKVRNAAIAKEKAAAEEKAKKEAEESAPIEGVDKVEAPAEAQK